MTSVASQLSDSVLQIMKSGFFSSSTWLTRARVELCQYRMSFASRRLVRLATRARLGDWVSFNRCFSHSKDPSDTSSDHELKRIE